MGVTLKDACRAIADTVGGFGIFTTTEAAPDLGSPDRFRMLISTELVDSERDQTAFNDYSFYIASGVCRGQQQTAARDAYASDQGAVYTSGMFTQIVPVGSEVEFHARLPRRRLFGEPGLREITNDAASRIWVVVPYTVVPGTNAGGVLGGFSAPTWVNNARQIVDGGRILADASGTGLVMLPDRLQTDSSGATVVMLRCPAHRWIKPAGETAYVFSDAGLVDDDDEIAVSPHALSVVGTWLAYRALARRAPDFELGAWSRLEQAAEAKAAAFIQFGVETATTQLGGQPSVSMWPKGLTL